LKVKSYHLTISRLVLNLNGCRFKHGRHLKKIANREAHGITTKEKICLASSNIFKVVQNKFKTGIHCTIMN